LNFISKYKHYLITFGIEFLILLLGFIIFRVANERMSEIGFSEYTLSRRNISFLQPLLMIGLGVAVPRYVSIHPERNSFLPASLFLMGLISCFFLLVLSLGAPFFAYLFFGNFQYSSFIFPMTILLIGYGFHGILYGFLRGKKEIYFSNIMQLINIGILPVLVVFLTHNVLQLLYFNGFMLILNLLIFTSYIFYKRAIEINVEACKADAIVLLKYGLPRVLGDFALLALLTIPTYLVLNFQKDMLRGGDIAYSITLFNLVGAAFGPLSLVLLPEIASFLVEKRIDLIRKRFNVFLFVSLFLTLIGYLTFYFFHDFVLNLLLGKKHRKELFEVANIILLGSFGYVLYIVLRSFLDAIHVKAKNATNLLISLGVYCLLILIGFFLNVEMQYYLYFFVISVTLLGILTWVKTYTTLKEMKW
jgi:O-antigen/teichoic acid export membrane protein